MQSIRISVVENDSLVATHFVPPAAARNISVIVGSAAGAPQTYYQSFCEYLSAQGFDVWSFDFRGIGQSQTRPLKSYRDIGFFAWANHDYPAVIEHVKSQSPNQPLCIIGHSVGGWMPAFTRASHHLHGILGVAAMSGHWRLMAAPERYLHLLAWYALVPLSTRLFGYWPKAVGLGRDVSAGLARDFAYCAKRKNFIFDAPQIGAADNVRAFKGVAHLLQMSDDPWGTPAAVGALAQQFTMAKSVKVERIDGHALGVGPIGHLNFFRREHRETLWPHALQRLNELIG
jgi:predicted alpha/beta hydrolase